MKKLLYVFITALLFVYGCTDEKENNTAATVIPDLKDDFYESVNYKQLSSWVIPADKSAVSNFTNMSDINYDRLNNLIQQAVLSNPAKETSQDGYNIKALYETAADWETRNTSGLGQLQQYINRIDEAKTLQDILKISMELDRKYNIISIFNIIISENLANPNEYAYYLVVNTGISREDWLSENTLFSTSYIEYLKNIWIINGTQSYVAEQIVREVTNMMKDIAKESLTKSELGNPANIYNPFPLSEIPAKLNNSITVENLINTYEGSADNTVIIVDTKAVDKLAEYLTDNNLVLIKNYIKTLIYDMCADSIGIESFKAYLAYKAQITGSTEIKTVEKSVNEQLQNALEYELGRMYAAEYVSDEVKVNIENMIADIKEIYRQRINNLKWMSAEIKLQAVNKLDKMQSVVGYDKNGVWPQELFKYSYTSKADGGIFINNMLLKKAAIQDYLFSNKNKPVNKKIMQMSPQTVNAFYSPTSNTMIILAGILQSPIYSVNANVEENAGGIGTVIAHEITHAFDNNGSLYDADGIYNQGKSWWQEGDFQKFNELAQKVIDYYNTYELIGYQINGTLTLSENIADLGAVSCITEYSLNKGYDLSKVYTAYGKMWATKKTEASEISAILNDIHSPAKIRVNAVLSAMDKFYEIFNIQPENGMYKAAAERPSIW